VARSVVTKDRGWKEAWYIMLHVGLDLSRKRVDVCLISDQGELVDELCWSLTSSRPLMSVSAGAPFYPEASNSRALGPGRVLVFLSASQT